MLATLKARLESGADTLFNWMERVDYRIWAVGAAVIVLWLIVRRR